MKKDSIEKLVEELRTVLPFKKTTHKGDVVLVISQDPQLLLYGLVTSMERDSTRKDEWWNIGLTFFSIPLQKVVWTLRTAQMTGQEIFTMGGEKRFFQAVEVVPEESHYEEKKISVIRPGKANIKRIK